MADSASNQPQSAFVVFEEAFARAAGTPLVTGNEVRLLRDAAENYPAWLGAIAAARRTIHFESYIIHDDETGQEFARALTSTPPSRSSRQNLLEVLATAPSQS